MSDVTYSDEQLKEALASLIDGSTDDTDGQHLYGFDPVAKKYRDDHKLSMLQRVEATQILDYRKKWSCNELPTEEERKEEFKAFCEKNGPTLNLQSVIQGQSPKMALAAEFKRASPSKGNIATHLKAGEQAELYASAGANIISILTEPHWFLGSLEDMENARLYSSSKATTQKRQRPAILRKDFLFHSYQIIEGVAHGADTVLLIVAVLPRHLLRELIDYCRSLHIEPLVEVHADEELNVALDAGAKVIGVNNRNLHTFQVDMSRTECIANELDSRGFKYKHTDSDASYTICSLSGMSTAFDVDRYRQAGVGMCLIGESLMRSANPVSKISELCLDPTDFIKKTNSTTANGIGSNGQYTGGTKIIKVCGITNKEDALVACQSGANLIGVIFVEKSKRCVSIDQAKDIVTAVRNFGERSDRIRVKVSSSQLTNGDSKVRNNTSALASLISASHSIETSSSHAKPLVVGVFQNHSHEYIRDVVDKAGLDMIQLHGKEGMEAANVNLCSVPAIRVVDIETDSETGKAVDGASKHILDTITSDPAAILLDTSIKGNKDGGGTGKTFDWNIVKEVQESGLPVIIAGGLKPDNIKEAVTTIKPWGIDVSSGVEETPGTKNHDKVRSFITTARKAAIDDNKGF